MTVTSELMMMNGAREPLFIKIPVQNYIGGTSPEDMWVNPEHIRSVQPTEHKNLRDQRCYITWSNGNYTTVKCSAEELMQLISQASRSVYVGPKVLPVTKAGEVFPQEYPCDWVGTTLP